MYNTLNYYYKYCSMSVCLSVYVTRKVIKFIVFTAGKREGCNYQLKGLSNIKIDQERSNLNHILKSDIINRVLEMMSVALHC